MNITASYNESQLVKSRSSLPRILAGHSLTSFKRKIILIGGFNGNRDVNEVWEGMLEEERNIFGIIEDSIDWKKCESMRFRRSRHFSMILNSKIAVLGGIDRKDCPMEYFDGSHWTFGPKVPFDITTLNAQCIVDRMGRVLILSKDDGLIVFDSKQETFKKYEKFGLREKRISFSALLQ